MNHPSLPRTTPIRSFLLALLLVSPAFALTVSDIESLRAKAEKGNAIAQYNLGLAYADRTGPAYDPVQAYVWLNVAATNGATGKALETITATLTPTQLAAANKLLAAPRSEPALADSPISAASPILPVQDPTAEAEKKQLSEELASSWKEADRIKTSLTSQLVEANKRLAITESALANKDKELSALQARLDSPSASAPNPADLDLLRRERDQLRAAFTKAENDRLSLQTALADANKTAIAAQNAQRLAESENASLKSAADKVSAERLSLAAQLENATSESARLRGELEAAKSSATAESPAAADLRSKFNANAKALADAQDELSSLKSASGGLSVTGIAVLKADRDHLADSVTALTHERDTFARQLADAKAATVPAPPVVAEAEVATARLANLEKSKIDADAKLDAALRTYTLNQAEIDRLQKALANIDGERATLSDKLDAANKELTALRPQAEATASSAEKVATLGNQLADTQKTLAERTAALDQAVRDMTAARQIAETSTNDLAAVREQLRQTQAQAAANANEALNLKTRLALAGAGAGSSAASRTNALAPAAVTLPTPLFAPPVAPSAAAPAKVPPAATEPRTHVVTAGDSLYSIAKRYYGSAGRWTEILAANRDIITNPNALALGTKLRIP